ncbi:hypothetical protein QBC34DRAFT_441795 [Podospora aff. communis PSN243]|uniref:J domain-containing protein n=1 Tax=Podospora aff. communis PSN243 TaxID=3040156 RepID=A0AAV9GBG0_9PEZI|nr:hypothetical protein QBC34DRAFT_441795 [Podospora aff. communis PSN243]
MAHIPNTDDYYAVLEIARTANNDEMKASYKRLALSRHPDKNRENPNATAEFQLLQAAYSTLIDAAARRKYNLRHPPAPTARPKPKPKYRPNPVRQPEEVRRCRDLVVTLEKELCELRFQKSQQESLHAKTTYSIHALAAALDQMREWEQQEAEEEAAREAFVFSWDGYGSEEDMYEEEDMSEEEVEMEEREAARQRAAAEREAERWAGVAEAERLWLLREEIARRIYELGRRIAELGRRREMAEEELVAALERVKAEGKKRKRGEEEEGEEAKQREKRNRA